MKAFTLVSFLLQTAIIVFGISIMLTVILPAVEKVRVSSILNDALQQMRSIDFLVTQVASEAIGSQRVFDLRVTDGNYFINNRTGSLEFSLRTKNSPIPPGTTSKIGNILLSTSTAGARAYEDDVDGDGEKELVLENEILKVGFEKYPKDYKIVGIGGEGYEFDSSGNSLDKGLVLYLPFEEGFGTITKDASGNENNGTLYNGPTWVDGKFGKALSFDGVNDYVRSTLRNMTEYTVIVLFNPARITDVPIYQNLLGTTSPGYYGAAIALEIRFGSLRAIYQDAWHTLSVNIPAPNNWYFASLVAKKASFASLWLYNDSGLIGNSTRSGIDWTGSFSTFLIGANSRGAPIYFNGTIDEVRVYNRALSDEEIKQLYEQTRIKFQNDFIQIKATKTFLNITNSTNTLYSLFIPSIRLDGNPIYYYFSTNETKIYFFDWYSNSWKIWMQGVNNATHGSPDFSLPKFKQEFKLLYSFDSSKTDAKINLTFILTNHDPFLRTIIDLNSSKYHRLEIPIETQNQQKACLIADYSNGKLASWNQRNCAERGNSYSSYSPVWNLKLPFNDTGLVGYWKFDEGSGTIAKDLSGYNNDGTLYSGSTICSNPPTSGCPTWVDGKFGKALSFDGVNDYVRIPNSPSLKVDYVTVEAWVYVRKVGTWINFVSKVNPSLVSPFNDYSLEKDSSDRIVFGVTVGGVWYTINVGSIEANTWTHVVGVFDGSSLRVYKNGILQGIRSLSGVLDKRDGDLFIGSYGASRNWVNGTIDEVRIYNRALTEEEIKQLYEQQVIFYDSSYSNKGNEWSLSSQVNKTTDLLNSTFYLDNDLYKTNTQQIELPLPDNSKAKVYYQAQDGSYRDVKELASIGQGLWSYEVTKDDSLVLWQSFDEGSGNIAHDFSDYGNDGIIYGANWVDGKFGKALSFDGVDDYVQIRDSPFLRPSSITISFWMYPRNISASGLVIKRTGTTSNDANWQAELLSDGKLRFSYFDGTGWRNFDTPIPVITLTNVWYYVVMTFQNGVPRIFVNGNLINDGSGYPPLRTDYTGQVQIGRGYFGYFNGTIDEVRIYNRALSKEEIKSHYLFGLPKHGIKNRLLLTSTLAGSDGFDYGIKDSYPGGSYWLDEKGLSLDSGLVGYWKFSEGSGTTTADSSGYGNDGTLVNGPTWVDGKFGKALSFDGVDDYVQIRDSPFLRPSSITISFWMYPRNISASGLVIKRTGTTSNDANWQAELLSDGKLRFSYFDGTGWRNFDTPIPVITLTNVWYYVVMTFQNGVPRIFVNGNLINDGSGYPPLRTDYTGQVQIGRGYFGYFNGTIDEVRIYNRALSKEEIKALYQAGRIKFSNDFLSVQSHPSIQTNLTNSTNSNLFNLIAEEIKVDNQPITNIYPANPINNSINVYFFDWKDNTWKIWMKGANNLTHGMPDWLDPRFKQEFKWRYEFKRTNYPSINLTFLMTAHDPFVRVFVDSVNSSASNNITLPFVPTQKVKRLGMKVDYVHKLPDWNQYNSKTNANPWKIAYAEFPLRKIGATLINSGESVNFHRVSDYATYGIAFEPIERTYRHNWVLDKTNNKYSFEFYLDNDLQKVNPTTIWDTVVTSYWSITAGTGTLYNDTSDYKSGTESLNASITSDSSGFIALTYNPAGTWDFLTKEFLALWLKLNSTSEYFTINITDSLGNWSLWNRSTPANTLQDLNNTWRRWVLPLRKPTTNSTYPANLSLVDSIEIKVKVNPSTDYLIKVDDIVIDVGQWVKVETFVPDKIAKDSYYRNWLWYLYSWNGSEWKRMRELYSNGETNAWNAYLLNGDRLAEVMLWPHPAYSYRAGLVYYYPGKRGETVSRQQGDWVYGPSTITYSSYYGVSNRLGIAIKLPPDDGQDNSTYGISQMKLKWEIYYDDEGKATYEFSNDNNRYYGLQNQLAPYYFLYNYQTNDFPLFITSNKRGAYSSYGSFLQVRADENETYDKIQFSYDFNSTINQNLMFTIGYLGLTDTYTSSSGNVNVPDIFEGYKTWQFGNESFESVANSTLTYYDLKDDSLVGYWDFDEGSGTIAGDRSGNGNTGTLVNGPTWVDGKFGKALSFDGVNDYVQTALNPIVSDNVTLIVWIYPRVIAGGYFHGFVGYQGASVYYRPFNLWVSPNAGLHWWISKSDNSQYHAGTIPNFFDQANKWYFIAFRKSGNKLDIFKYDQKISLPDSPFSDLYKPPYYWIGRVDNYFNGIIDEVRIYNRALSDEEIKAHYFSGLESHQYGKFGNPDNNVTHTFSYSFKYNSTYIDDFNVGIKRYVGVEDSSTNLQPITPKDTVLHLRFNEGSGNKVKDISGFGNDGTLYGFSDNAVNWTDSMTNFGKALSFDGVNDYVEIQSNESLKINTSLTLAMWFKPNSLPSGVWKVPLVKGMGDQDYSLQISPDNILLWWANDLTPTSVSFGSITTGVWYHAVAVYDKSLSKVFVYLNGELKNPGGTSVTGSITHNDLPLHIGSMAGLFPFNGTIDEVLIINRSLSADEVYQLYLGGYFRRIGNNIHRVASYDGLNYISFNLTDKDDSSQTDYDQRKLRIEVDYSRNTKGLASFVFSNSTNNLHGLQSMNLPYISLINSNSRDRAQFITTSHKTQSFEPLRITSNENGIIRKVSFYYDFNGSKRFSFGLGYSGLVDTASDSDNNKIPDYLEDKTKGIEWSNESISDIAYQSLYWYEIKDNPYKIVPDGKGKNEYYGKGDFTGGLVGYWKFDEGSGTTTADSSGYGNTGTLYDANTTNDDWNTPPKWVDGKFGKALSFDGIDDWVGIPYSANLDVTKFKELTYTIWIYPTTPGKEQALIGESIYSNGWKGVDFVLNVFNAQNNVAFWYPPVGPISFCPNVLTYNSWNFIAVTATYGSNGKVKIFVNGVKKCEWDYPYTPIPLPENIQIGIGSRANGSLFFNGTIDEVRIYNRALGEEEIKALYLHRAFELVGIQDVKIGNVWYHPLGVENAINYATRIINSTLSYKMFYPTNELRFSLNGSIVSTNDLIKSIKYKGQTEILPVDSSIRINQNESSTYGFGRTYLVTQGEGLDQAQLIAEVNSLNGSYKVTYSLPSMADYLLISTDYPYKIENIYGFKIGNSVANDNIQISGSNLPPACYNASQITNYYACSYDSTEGVSTGLIYKGLKTNFEKLCYSNYTHWDNTQNYKLSVESENKEEIILPLIKGSCDKISSKYYLIQADKLPKNFGDLSLPIRETLLQLSLSYKNIKIVGSDVYPRGTYTLCIRKEAEDLTNRITYVRIGSC